MELQDYDEVTALLNRAKSLCSLKTLLPTVDASIRAEIELQFQTKGERFGDDWADLRERYLEYRAKYGNPKGRTAEDILYLSGALRRSFTVEGDEGHVMELVSEVEAVVGSSVDYAEIQHEGGTQPLVDAPWWVRVAFGRKKDASIEIVSRPIWVDGQADEMVNEDLEAFAVRVLNDGAGGGATDEVPF